MTKEYSIIDKYLDYVSRKCIVDVLRRDRSKDGKNGIPTK